ncbi:hypothetical protein Bca52824_095311 [Brassica carinata]|uniref:Uncharacterized protein n=1 Tax=Brassica carinata TaxID=52824 RepID=A0A8X7P0L6_BRACI|nr:hypothetical protein Bca52824_095311 [Brassica carinata]
MAPSTEFQRIPPSRPLHRITAPRLICGKGTSIDLIGAFAIAPSSSPPISVPPGVVPPGAVPHASVGSSSAVPAAPAPYVRRREDALLHAPSRRNQPHLHPDKINGALWFGIDPEVHDFIRATWQGNYWGRGASWNFAPPEKKDQWWHAHCYRDVAISQKMRDNRNLPTCRRSRATMVEKYNTEKEKKSAKAAKSRKSAPVGKKMHKHMVDEGLDEPPSYTALRRKTHTGKDGSFLDLTHEELVLEVEEAVEEMLQDGSPLGDGQTDSTAASNVKRYLLNQEYIKLTGLILKRKDKEGYNPRPWGVQYKNSGASANSCLTQATLTWISHVRFETTISEVKEDIAGVKEDFTALKTEINAFKTEVTGMSASRNSQHYSANCPISSFHSCLNCTTISASTSVTTSRSAPSSSSISTSATTLSSVHAHHNISRPIPILI